MSRSVMLLALLACNCGRGYSDGERAGVVVKFSNKGLIWKSWEGTMNLGGIRAGTDSQGNSTVEPNTWDFHVADYDLVPTVERALTSGRPVTVHYVQWWIGPLSQDSAYDVDRMTP